MPRDRGIESSYNKGEWSELYAFVKLLKEGRIYAADENVNKLNIFLPILKIIREERENEVMDYKIGVPIKIYKNNELIGQVSVEEVEEKGKLLFKKITADDLGNRTFKVLELKDFLEKIKVTRVKEISTHKADIKMQIQDINTGYEPVVGFSIKSELGKPPTLLNASKSTRVQYLIEGLSEEKFQEINSINKNNDRCYRQSRIEKLYENAKSIEFCKIKSQIFNNNLIMLDSLMPNIFGEIVLLHYREGIYKLVDLAERLTEENPMHYPRQDIYEYKIKKFLCAVALGMLPATDWDGLDEANGGYIIVKRDGDVVCYFLYNRNFFEKYLLINTRIDRPDSRTDYGYLYKEGNKIYIDLNIQIRFL